MLFDIMTLDKIRKSEKDKSDALTLLDELLKRLPSLQNEREKLKRILKARLGEEEKILLRGLLEV